MIHQEQNQNGDLEWVIDSPQNGTSDSPESGFADIRNVNIDSIPGIALCNYKLVNQLPVVAGTISVNDYTVNVITISIPIKYGTLITVYGLSAKGIQDGNYYFISNSSGTSGVYGYLYSGFNPTGFITKLTTMSSNGGSGTYSTINLGTPKCYAFDTGRNGASFNYYILDNIGNVWVNWSGSVGWSTNNIWVQLNVAPGAYSSGNGLCFYKKYLFVYRDTAIDLYDAYNSDAGGYAWTNGRYTTFNATAGSACPHPAIWGQNDRQYYGDTSFLGNIYVTNTAVNSQSNFIFNTPTQPTLNIPSNEVISTLCEPSIDASPGNYIYLGTNTSQYIYPWNKTPQAYTVYNATSTQILTTSYDAPLVMPEVGCFGMININKLVYILAGQRGNIYYTNGSSIVHFSKIPYQPTQTPYPIFTWGGIMSLRNNLVVGVADANNNASGVYSITLAVGQMLNNVAGAIRYIGQPSSGMTNPTVLIPNANGLNYYAGSTGVIDYLDTATPSFYTYDSSTTILPITGTSYIESDLISIGTAFSPTSITKVSAKLDSTLVSGEKFRICMRSNLSDSYVKVFEVDTNVNASLIGAIDGKSDNGIPLNQGDSTATPQQGLKWVQFRADLDCSASGIDRSFVRLKEIRFS